MIHTYAIRSVLVFTALLGAAWAQNLRILAPCTDGCSYEVLAQTLSEAMKREGLAETVTVYNSPGLAAVAQFAKLQGNPNQLMIVGYGMVGTSIAIKSPLKMSDFTPIARLTADYETLVVAGNSPYRTLNDLISAFKANPSSIIWGGSTVAGTAHIVAGLIARAVDVEPSRVRFVPSAGNLQASNAMLQGQITVASVQYAAVEDMIRSGQLRALGITAPSRVAGIPVPTLNEQGVRVEFVNWRAVVAPPGLSAQEKVNLILMFNRLSRSATWQSVLRENGWNSYYQSGETFRYFIEQQQESVAELLQALQIVR